MEEFISNIRAGMAVLLLRAAITIIDKNTQEGCELVGVVGKWCVHQVKKDADAQ